MKDKQRFYLWGISLVAALGGFLFGFETGVVSGLTESVKEHFQLSDVSKGWFVSSAILGCILGAGCAGFMADRWGRKTVLFFTGILFTVGAIGCAYPYNWTAFIVVRIIGGAGIGAASMIVPLYIAEIAPPGVRGRLGTFFQLAIVFGLFVSYFSNALINSIPALCPEWFAHPSLSYAFIEENWRGMFLVGSVPAIIYTLLLFLVPESPRWQLINGKEEMARKTLNKLLDSKEVERELADIRMASQQETGALRELFSSRIRFGIVIAVLLMFFSQFTGINAVMYFGNEVFKDAGFSKDFSFWLQTIAIGVTNIVFTVIAIWKIDQWGRKSLLKIGTPALLFLLAAITLFFFVKRMGGINEQTLLILPVLMVLFVGAFAMSWGPVPWVVVAEIFPAKIRGRAVAVGTMTIWASCFLVAQTFPILSNRGGPEACFGLYTLCMVFAVLFVWFYLPETKGKTLEEIEKELYKK